MNSLILYKKVRIGEHLRPEPQDQVAVSSGFKRSVLRAEGYAGIVRASELVKDR